MVFDDDGTYITSVPRANTSMVSNLIDESCMEWKTGLIEDIFNERDVKCVVSIPLTSPSPKDDLMWAFSKDGY